MASAITVHGPLTASLDLMKVSPSAHSEPEDPFVDILDASELALKFRAAVSKLQDAPEYFDEAVDDEDILSLPLDRIRIDDDLHNLPRRKSTRQSLAEATARLLYPAPGSSLSPLIRYEEDRVRIRTWIRLQRKYDILVATREREEKNWSERIRKQGPWDKDKLPISLEGPPSLPMPVKISDAESLVPFFQHLHLGGTSELSDEPEIQVTQIVEPNYKTQALEFPKGVIYEDRRMDLCKMVVGPPNIGPLMESLKTNTFIQHFLLGNNIIGPTGAKHVAAFIKEYPDRMDTWYLAGNCIDGASFSTLVDSLTASLAVTNVWLKRNPLGPDSAHDLFCLITQTPNLRTLDLDQTELGDVGVDQLFNELALHPKKTRLENIYLNGNGIGLAGSTAIGKYLSSPNCTITSIYMSNNPITNKGAAALASGLKHNSTLRRLSLQSTALTDTGAVHLFASLLDHPALTTLDVGQSYATEDLGQAYNYFTDAVAPSLAALVNTASKLEYLNLSYTALTNRGLNTIFTAASTAPSLLYVTAKSIHPQARDWASVKDGQEHARLEKMLAEHLAANVKARYGEHVTYSQWTKEEKRWVISDKEDVRKIDSVYRNRDMGLARRGLKRLDKWWEEGDDTLEKVMGPICTMRKHRA